MLFRFENEHSNPRSEFPLREADPCIIQENLVRVNRGSAVPQDSGTMFLLLDIRLPWNQGNLEIRGGVGTIPGRAGLQEQNDQARTRPFGLLKLGPKGRCSGLCIRVGGERHSNPTVAHTDFEIRALAARRVDPDLNISGIQGLFHRSSEGPGSSLVRQRIRASRESQQQQKHEDLSAHLYDLAQ